MKTRTKSIPTESDLTDSVEMTYYVPEFSRIYVLARIMHYIRRQMVNPTGEASAAARVHHGADEAFA